MNQDNNYRSIKN